MLKRLIARLTSNEDNARQRYLRRSLENPSVSLADPAAWEDIFGGHRTDAGVVVNGRTVMKFSPVWQAVQMISQDVSCIPTFVYRRLREGGKERDRRHPAYRLVRRRANPLHTAQMWKQITLAQALLFGGSYSVINRDEFGNPLELLPLDPETTYLDQFAGRQAYRTVINGREVFFDPFEIFHLPGVVLDGVDGLNLVKHAKQSLGRGMGAEKYAARFFQNNTMPNGILTHPHRLKGDALANLRESIKSIHGGLDNAHRVAILEEGMTWTQMGLDPEKAQLVATLEFSVKDVARWFNLPPHRLGDNSRTSFNSVEQENLSYQISTLSPWFCKLREEAYQKLLTERQKRLDTHTVEELRVAILMADATTRANFYSRGLLDGWLNRDEVRDYENLNPIPDGKGKQFMVPLNMQVLGDEDEPGDGGDQDDTQDDDDARAAAILVGLLDATRRASKRLVHYTLRAAKRPDGFCDWMERLHDDHQDVIGAMFGPTCEQARALDVAVPDAGDLARCLIDTWKRHLDQLVQSATPEQLPGQAQQLADLVERGDLNQWARRQIEWNGEQSLALAS